MISSVLLFLLLQKSALWTVIKLKGEYEANGSKVSHYDSCFQPCCALHLPYAWQPSPERSLFITNATESATPGATAQTSLEPSKPKPPLDKAGKGFGVLFLYKPNLACGNLFTTPVIITHPDILAVFGTGNIGGRLGWKILRGGLPRLSKTKYTKSI